MGVRGDAAFVLFGPDALEYRLQDSETVAALVDPASLPGLAPVRDKLPLLKHVIGVAGARESWLQSWEKLLDKASRILLPSIRRRAIRRCSSTTSGTTGPPRGRLCRSAL